MARLSVSSLLSPPTLFLSLSVSLSLSLSLSLSVSLCLSPSLYLHVHPLLPLITASQFIPFDSGC